MASLFSKASTFLTSLAHRNLDRAIKANSPEYMKQLVRDVEEAEGQAAAATAGAKGELTAARQKADRIRAHIKELEDGARTLLSDSDASNDHFADDIMLQVEEEERNLASQMEIVAAGETAVQAVQAAWEKLRAKRKQLVDQVNELQNLDRATKAKEAGASAVKAANEAIGGIDGKSIDDLEGDIRRRAAVADATLEQQTSSPGEGAAQAVRDSRAAARVAKLRAEIDAKRNGAGPAKTGGPAVAASTETM